MGLKVVTAPTSEPITLAEAKLQCRVDTDADDDLIELMISAAREYAEQKTERALARQTLGLYLDDWPEDGDIMLPRPPFVSITHVKYVDEDGTLQTIDSGNYAIDTGAGQDVSWLMPAYDYTWPSHRDVANAVEIQYQAGYASNAAPASVRLYILAAVAAMYKQREALAQSDRLQIPVAYIDGLLDGLRIFRF